MTTIKLIKETSLRGEVLYKIVDQNDKPIGSYSTASEADINFTSLQWQIEKYGNKQKTEVIKEFTQDQDKT